MPAIYLIEDNYGEDIGDWYYNNLSGAEAFVSDCCDECDSGVNIVKYVRVL